MERLAARSERLAARGDDVRNIQRQSPPGLPPGVAFICANLEDAFEAQPALANVDAVFALSASLIDPMSTFTSGPERRLLRESNTSEIGGKAEVPGTRSKRCCW